MLLLGTSRFLVLCLDPSALCLWLCTSWGNACPLAGCSWDTGEGFQVALANTRESKKASLAVTRVTGRRKLDKSCESEVMHPAINRVTVTVISLASDLLEQSIPWRCKAVSLCALLLQQGPAVPREDGARAGQQQQRQSLCDPPQVSRPPLWRHCSRGQWQPLPLILEHGRFQSRIPWRYFCCFPNIQFTQWAFIV